MTAPRPNPALVAQRAVQRLPRVALWLFCAAYVLPGLFSRQPWKGSDITSFGYMANIAAGRSSWWVPTVAGLPSDGALLPYWIGAAAVRLLGPWLGDALAARVPFALLLVAVLALTWRSAYHLARTEPARPLAFAFGGEAAPLDYARAIADGALLAMIATLGLLQLGHETTPELGQLASIALCLYAVAAGDFAPRLAPAAAIIGLPALAASGAPSIGLALGVVSTVLCARSDSPRMRRLALSVVAGTVLSLWVARALGVWGWHVPPSGSGRQAWTTLRLVLWFTWPCWPLAGWTLWRWRRHVLRRHIAAPLSVVAIATVACVVMGGSDRALMLALPGLALLAAFALPTLQRATAAAIDWFSVFFFSTLVVVIWLYYLSAMSGLPAKPAQSVSRLVPGFVAELSLTSVGIAAVGTVAWIWLVRWRAGRNRHALWKSLVLPASGVALCWLMMMSLWLPALDYAKSYGPLMQRVAQHVPAGACIAAPGVIRSELVALEVIARYRVDALSPPSSSRCPYLLQQSPSAVEAPKMEGWRLIARVRRPVDRDEMTDIYRRRAEPR